MKESEKTVYDTVCDINPLKPAEINQLNDTAFELKGSEEQRNHKAFDDFPMNIENGMVDSQRQEDKNGFSDAACLSSFDRKEETVSNSPDHGYLGTEHTNESKDLHFSHNGFPNPFLNRCDHYYTDKKVLEYDVVKDICVDMGIHEEKTDVDDACIKNGYKSTNPFLEPEEGEEDSCEHTTKGIIETDDFVTSNCGDTSSIAGNECDGTDRVTLSDQMSDERQSEGFKESSTTQALSEEEDTKSNEEQTAIENVQEQSLVTEDARNTKESSNDNSKVQCHDETPEKGKDANFHQVQVRNASDQNKSQVQPDDGDTSFSGARLVEYSGPMIAYSGSISHRSDASTASCRSFAFPILQSEWDSSPVRMAKADKRHYRKHKGWRSGLLCCRF